MKKILCVLLSIIIAGILPVIAHAAAIVTVDSIRIVNVEAPVAGEYPTYSANTLGLGYSIDSSKSVYYDAYWSGTGEKWYYIKNGIGWYDITEDDWVYEHEQFIAGHDYEVAVYLVTEDGFEFAHNNFYEPTVTATVNGNTAEADTSGSNCVSSQRVWGAFVCEPVKISTIMIYDIDEPMAGEHPDYTATTAYPEYYILDTSFGTLGTGIAWYDCDGNELAEDDVFVKGEIYSVGVKVKTVKTDGVDVCKFASLNDISFMIDRKLVLENAGDLLYMGTDFAFGKYEFANGAVPTDKLYNVSGNINSFATSYNEVSVALIPETSGMTYFYWTSGENTSFTFEKIPKGIYTLRVAKENHVTREYIVYVENGEVVQDATLHLLGDATGDGKVNARDSNILKLCMAGVREVDSYQRACIDVTGDGVINARDTLKLKTHILGKSSIWE